MSAAPLVLIDLSSIAHPLWHLSGSEPDPNWTSTQIIAKVHALASGQPHVAICVDGPRSRAIRKAIDPTYKAQRDTAPEALFHQITCAIDALRADGFPIWEADGYEADDVIASAVDLVVRESDAPIGTPGLVGVNGASYDCLIVTADKDLCQLVGPRVTIKHALKGDVLDAPAVVAKFGVTPAQIQDYLALVGDASDNIKGAKGIGAKTAAKLLAQFGTLDAIMATGGEGLTPAVRDSLVEFASRCDVVRSLIALRTDVPVRIEEAFAPRGVAATEETTMAETDAPTAQTSEAKDTGNSARETPESRVDRAVESGSVDNQRADSGGVRPNLPPQVIDAHLDGIRQSAGLVHVPYEMQLEPRSMAEARQLAADMHASRLFSAYGTPAAVLSTILAGRELGLQAMASLRAFHIIEGRPTLSAGIIQAMVVKSPTCEYFRCTERTNERATFETKRRDNPPLSLTFTLEEAKLAVGGTLKAGSGWTKNPADMCVARAATKLARLVYPDIVSGLYAPEEFQ